MNSNVKFGDWRDRSNPTDQLRTTPAFTAAMASDIRYTLNAAGTLEVDLNTVEKTADNLLRIFGNKYPQLTLTEVEATILRECSKRMNTLDRKAVSSKLTELRAHISEMINP